MKCTEENDYGGAKRGSCDKAENERCRVYEDPTKKWKEGGVGSMKESGAKTNYMRFWVEWIKFVFLAVLEKVYREGGEVRQTLRGIQRGERRQEKNSGIEKATARMDKERGRVKEAGQEEEEFDRLWRQMNREIDEKLMRLRMMQKRVTKMKNKKALKRLGSRWKYQ